MPDIRVVRIGRRVLFAVADFGAWVEAHAAVPLVSELPQHAWKRAGEERYSAARFLRAVELLLTGQNTTSARRGIWPPRRAA